MYCPRCDQNVTLNFSPGAVHYCPNLYRNNGCYVVEHFYQLFLERRDMETKDLLAERGKTHGDFSTNTIIMRDLKLVIQGAIITRIKAGKPPLTAPQGEALDMICHKIGRILDGDPNFKDHWADIAGYAKLVADRCPE